MITIIKATLIASVTLVSFRPTNDEFIFRTYGVKINVTDMEEAVDFYCNKLGFKIETRVDDSQVFLLTGETNKLVLNKVKLLAPTDEWESRAVLTLQVNHLDSAVKRMRANGVEILDNQIRKEAVGNALYVTDPFGNKISMMHQTIAPVKPFQEPRIYNYGFFISDMSQARAFYCDKFGFVVRSENYLPLDLPLGHSDNSFAFMLHYREGVKPIRFNMSDNERFVVMIQTQNLDSAISALKEKGVKFQQQKPVNSKIGRYISFYDPFGYLSDLVEM